MSDRVLVDMQSDIVGRLLADEFFSDIAVLSERVAELDYEVQVALGIVTGRAGKAGALVIVQQPTASDEMPNVTFGALDIEWTILVMEETKINRDSVMGTGHSALEIARRVVRVLKHASLGSTGRLMRPGTPLIAPAAAVVEGDDGFYVPVSYAVKFSCTEADSEVFLKVANPSISPAGGALPQTVTLACSTAGSSIYYTTDGSYPRSGATGSSLYSAPFSVATASTVRAAAYKSGLIASNVVSQDYP
jgi:hypothetical protein